MGKKELNSKRSHSLPIEGEGQEEGLYGYYPDGTRYRKYPHRIPFMQLVDVGGETFLRLRQATELGYADVPVGGVGDIAYPTSLIRRSRTVGGGRLCNTLTASGSNLVTLVEYV